MSTYDTLSISLMPIDISLADKETNIALVDELTSRMPEGTDLVVLPELFSTGYIDDAVKAKELAEREDGSTIQYLKSLAAKYQAAFCGSFLSYTGHMIFNRAFFIEPNGETNFYDKRHLFCLSREAKICTRGISLPPVIRYRRWDIAVAVCYDLRFPAWLRNTPDRRYDLLVIPANWPDKREYAWKHLLIARAIENMAYVAGCNRAGTDKFGNYDEMSYIFDFMGKPTGTIVSPGIIHTVLSKRDMLKMRDALPFLDDEDIFQIKMY